MHAQITSAAIAANFGKKGAKAFKELVKDLQDAAEE